MDVAARPCLVLVDLQHDFFSVDGFMHLPHDALVRNVARAVAHARAHNWLVVWVRSHYGQAPGSHKLVDVSDDWMPHVPRNDRYHSGTHSGPQPCCVAGTKGAELFKPFRAMQMSGDEDVVKTFFSCFSDTNLAAWLPAANAKLLGFNARLLRDCTLARTDNQQAADTLAHITRHYVSAVLNSYELAPVAPAELAVVHDTRLLMGLLEGESDVYNRLLREVRFAQMHSRGAPVPRLVAMQVQPDGGGNLPLYRHPADEHPRSEIFTPLVRLLRDAVHARIGLDANHALIQHYRDSNDNIGEHSDKTLDIARGTVIVNLSFGATREMILKAKRAGPDGAHESRRVRMVHNSLFVLCERTNRDYYHSIRPDKRPDSVKEDDCFIESGGRISITFRHVATWMTADGTRVFGQGAPHKTLDALLAAPVAAVARHNSERIAEELTMLRAFSFENHADAASFSWDDCYGRGFECVNLNSLADGGEDRFKVAPDCATLFFVNGSIPNWRALMCMEYLGVPFVGRRLRVMSKPKDTRDPVFLRINPRGKTPTLVEADGTVVYESIAILLHLQRKHDSAGKLLGERADRVFRLVMESENVTRAYAPVEKLFERHALTDAQRDKARAAPAKLERELQLWERYLVDGPFIAGTTTITLADMAFFPCLAYALHRGFVLHPRRFARLTAYVAHMQALSCVIKSTPFGWDQKGVDLFARIEKLE